MSRIEELADRVERLLLRHEELQRTHALLNQQLDTVMHERDNLKSRLSAARSRIDVLLDRLPREAPAAGTTAPRAADGLALPDAEPLPSGGTGVLHAAGTGA